jgi:hypothetical protein
LADIDSFNVHYGSALPVTADPMMVVMPKEVLINATRRAYNESHNPQLFTLLNFDIVKQNCRYFSRFIQKFDKAIAANSR